MFASEGVVGLTDEQTAAATHPAGNLLIVAGAGTGKTTTLAARLAHLVERGTPPERILLLTFSRRAAAELVARAATTTGREVATAVWAGTFHSVANRFLRRYGRAVGLDPSFTILDQADAPDLLSLLRDERRPPGEAPRRHAGKDLLASIWSRCVNTRRPLGEVVERWYPWCREDVAEMKGLFGAYIDHKAAGQVLDYDDLLLQWWALLRTEAVRPLIAEQVDHVLVDEVQDTNALQGDILEALVELGATVTAVGDDAQAIYGFRAATVRNILDFPGRFDAAVVPLTRNHRSTPQILRTANAVMAEAAERHDKELRAERPDGPVPRLVTSHDEHAQALAICGSVLDHHERGTPLRRQAVLFRTTHHSQALQVELAVRQIPFVLYGGLRFLEAAHVKDLICALRLVENPRDDLAWFRVLQLLDGVGPALARRVVAALPSAPDLVDAAVRAGIGPDGPGSTGIDDQGRDGTHPSVGALQAALEAARSPAVSGRPGAQVAAVRAWLDGRVRRRHRNHRARWADLDRLEEAATGAPSLERFLTDLVLDPPSATGELAGPPHLDDDYLVLSTIHSAKGAEWDVVHLMHLADGCLPSEMATGRPEEIEEERRLLHVAMTRARDELHLHVPLRYHFHRQNSRGRDGHSYAQRSRFLSSAVVATCHEVTDRSAEVGTIEALGGPAGPRSVEVDQFLTGLLT